jgi:hypothetical protein
MTDLVQQLTAILGREYKRPVNVVRPVIRYSK